ncbi:MAG TPA: phospholipid carrier-dependent glycosyltransferase [Candidatus Acidoferrum sp.]|nr:phospholipid carrier-dependent glycosyltransferase [Candidatus Acidoferrum sp.]
MTKTCIELPASPPLSPAARLLWLALIVATLYLCYFHNLGALGLVGPDEPRYAWIARDMQETGDYVTPRLYGKPWFEKPPLYYWSAALSFKLFGVSETTARLPSAIAALLATLALAWLTLRLYGAETARWLLLLLPTTVGMIGFSHAAATDMPFAATLTIAMVCATKLLNLVPSAAAPAPDSTTSVGRFRSFSSFTSSTSFTSFLFGLFLGLATLAKGPAAIILSGGAVLLWALFTKRWHDAFRCLHPVAIASFCLTSLPWYILCARRNPDFFRIFILEHNFSRFLTPQFQHIQPFWYYIPIVLIAFLPWAPLLVISAAFGGLKVSQERTLSPANRFSLCWALFCLLFFSLSQSKLPGYILPAIPAIASLLARSLVSLMPLFAKYFRMLLVLFGSVFATSGVLLFLFLGQLHRSSPTAKVSRAAALILLMFALGNWLLALRKTKFDRRIPAAACSVLPILLLTVSVPGLLPAIFPYDPSGKTLAAETMSTHLSSDPYVGPISRGEYFGLNFYLHRELKEWDKTNSKVGYLLLRSRGCRSELEPGWKCTDEPVVLPKSGWFIFRVQPDPSLDGLGGSNGSKLGDRQPRQEK